MAIDVGLGDRVWLESSRVKTGGRPARCSSGGGGAEHDSARPRRGDASPLPSPLLSPEPLRAQTPIFSYNFTVTALPHSLRNGMAFDAYLRPVTPGAEEAVRHYYRAARRGEQFNSVRRTLCAGKGLEK